MHTNIRYHTDARIDSNLENVSLTCVPVVFMLRTYTAKYSVDIFYVFILYKHAHGYTPGRMLLPYRITQKSC